MPSEILLTQTAPNAERARDPLYYFTLLFLSFLQGCFKQRPEGTFRYSEDADLSEIVIADQVPCLQKETVPRIITARGPAQIIPLFADDMVTRNIRTGEKKRTVLISIPMTFNCIAKLGVETQEIAFFTAHNIWAHRVLLQQWGIHKIDKAFSMSAETPTNAIFAPEVVPQGVMISLVVPFFVRWTSTMTPNNNPALRELDAFLKSKLAPSLTPLKEPIVSSFGQAFNQTQYDDLIKVVAK